MVSKGLLVRLQAQEGMNSTVEEFLRSALPFVEDEAATTAWFAIHFGGAEYGIFDAFADESGRQAHLAGAVATMLMERASTLLATAPKIEKLDVLAHKLPPAGTIAHDTKALLLTFEPKSGHEATVEQFLRGAQAWVEEEPGTTAWFAIRMENGRCGIFDCFPDQAGRLRHLSGRVAQELAKHAFSLLGGLPDPEFPEVLAEKL